MSNISNRLALFLRDKGKGQTAFEEEAGLGRGYVKKATENMGQKTLDKIKAHSPELNIDWLLTGEGSTPSDTLGQRLHTMKLVLTST